MLNLDLKFRILKKFRTQAEFAVFIGEHESKVSAVLRGRQKLSPHEVKRWCQTLDCDSAMFEPPTQEEINRKEEVS